MILPYCFNCFNTKHSFNSRNCINGIFLYDCRNVQDSFMCWNLRNKSYCIRNQQYTKESYRAEMQKINFGSRKAIAELKQEFESITRDQAVHRENLNLKTTNSIGNYATNVKNCRNCFYWEESQDCFNCLRGLKVKSAIDITGVFESELCGNMANAFGSYAMKYSTWSSNCRFSEYLDQCVRCENCFGCVGLKDKKFCILNTQYEPDEYAVQKSKIKSQMSNEDTYGEYLPQSMTYCDYDLSAAQIYFPLPKKETVAQTDGISPDRLPDDINDVKDEITTQALICPETHYRFNIAPRELDFYRMMRIPLPRTHSDHRNLERFKKLSVIDAYPYRCTYCDKEIMAYYPPEWHYQKIACESCYQREIS